MKLNDLRPAEGGGVKAKKRLGRGIGSGLGKTSGRGHKGQNARSGGGVRPGFEGGQLPLFRRLPKRGFTNIFSKEYATLNVDIFNRFSDGTVVDAELLVNEGVIRKGDIKDGLKILGNGEITAKLTIKAKKFTKTAVEKIEAAGGKAEVI